MWRQARERRKFAVAEGDHLTMLNVYEAFIKVTDHAVVRTSLKFTFTALKKAHQRNDHLLKSNPMSSIVHNII